jgi:hypothetical protein
MSFTFGEESMFDPNWQDSSGIPGMPNLPAEALQNTAKQLNPDMFNFL